MKNSFKHKSKSQYGFDLQQFSLLVFLKYESRSLRPKGRGLLERGVFFWFFSKKTKKTHPSPLVFFSTYFNFFNSENCCLICV